MAIPNARIPIVKCVDTQSGISCDLSFKNKMAVHNSKFIKDMLNADERVLQFAVVIRYWASRQKLSGNVVGSGGLTINNYALTMLVIFFLQCENILPPVKKLQENLDDQESILIEGWQFAYKNYYLEHVKDYIAEHPEGRFRPWRWKEWLCRFFDFYTDL